MTGASYDPAQVVGSGFDDEIARLQAQVELSGREELDLLVALGLPPGRTVEVGAGSGAFLRALQVRRPDLEATGLEPDPRLRAAAATAGTALLAGDAYALPFADAEIDCLLYRFVLQHLERPADALREALRVLRPGGRVFVIDVDARLWGHIEPAVPAAAVPQAKFALAQRRRNGDRSCGTRLSRLLREVGFPQARTHVYAVTSDDHPVSDFALHLGPGRLAPLVATGEMSLRDVGTAAAAWRSVVTDPDAWVMLLGCIAWSQKPGARSGAALDGREGI